jgi:hypothetical protein
MIFALGSQSITGDQCPATIDLGFTVYAATSLEATTNNILSILKNPVNPVHPSVSWRAA